MPQDWLAIDELRLAAPAISPRAGLAGLFGWIEARAATVAIDPRVSEAISRMQRSRSGVPVGRIAREAGVSERTLGRLFERDVGMPPMAYRRILRFNRALSKLRSPGSERLAEVAASLGFADQSHMARELRSLGGFTSMQFREAAPPTDWILTSGEPPG